MSGIKRRTTLKLMALGGGSLMFPSLFSGCGGSGGNETLQGGCSQSPFTLSVASGDPREDSVVLWTYIQTTLNSVLTLSVEVAKDSAFEEIVYEKELQARPEFGHNVKVRVPNLQAYSNYFYRFNYNGCYSNVGRTKTAPLSSMQEDIKFAFLSCQDYAGRYYNSLAHLNQNQSDIDFIVHLGDYIYETTGDSSFQTINPNRAVNFSDTQGAITLGSQATPYYAASSLDNYRELYKIYRSDPELQKLHENFPMIAIWDDHEFSDDSYKNVGTYFDGVKDEANTLRKQNAERAYFEFMPIEVGLNEAGELNIDSTILYDEEANEPIIYRAFNFGQNLDLLMSDYRTFRPDHLIPEDAFIGQVIITKEQLQAIGIYGSVSSAPYINIDALPTHKQIITGVLTTSYINSGMEASLALTKATQSITGNLDLYVAQEMLKAYNATVEESLQVPLLYNNVSEFANYPQGFSYFHLGKTSNISAGGMGSRYMVTKELFDLYASMVYAQDNQSENFYGEVQTKWLEDALDSSTTAWRILGNSTSFTPMILDLRNINGLPEMLKNRFYLNVDQTDGFPNQKAKILEKLRTNASAIISGDIHAFFMSDHNGVSEFTGSAVSSSTFYEMLQSQIKADATLSQVEGISDLVENLDELLLAGNTEDIKTRSEMKFVDTKSNGYAVVSVSNSQIQTTYYRINHADTLSEHYDTIEGLDVQTQTFQVQR